MPHRKTIVVGLAGVLLLALIGTGTSLQPVDFDGQIRQSGLDLRERLQGLYFKSKAFLFGGDFLASSIVSGHGSLFGSGFVNGRDFISGDIYMSGRMEVTGLIESGAGKVGGFFHVSGTSTSGNGSGFVSGFGRIYGDIQLYDKKTGKPTQIVEVGGHTHVTDFANHGFVNITSRVEVSGTTSVGR